MKTIDDIRKLQPCYDPVSGVSPDGNQINDGFLPDGWQGTAEDVLRNEKIPPRDRLFVVVNTTFLEPDTIGALVDQLKQKLKPELASRFKRFWPVAVEANNVGFDYEQQVALLLQLLEDNK